jgi:hypothetical protein
VRGIGRVLGPDARDLVRLRFAVLDQPDEYGD